MMAVKAKKRKPPTLPKTKKASPIAIGIDLSPSSIAGAIMWHDTVIDEVKGPAWYLKRWNKEVSHWDKLRDCACAAQIILDLLRELNCIVVNIEDVHIGVEEPPARVMNAGRYREQCELSGAFVGGLLRYGYPSVHSINIKTWQASLAAQVDKKANKEFDKWQVKNAVRELYPDTPKWKDLIRNDKLGLIPKPRESKAMPAQPDDRFDSMGIMDYVWIKYCEPLNGR